MRVGAILHARDDTVTLRFARCVFFQHMLTVQQTVKNLLVCQHPGVRSSFL